MGDRSRDASALLGMEGFVVCSQSEEDGELYVLVETTANVAGCPSCGVKATGHGRSVVEVRDLPAGGLLSCAPPKRSSVHTPPVTVSASYAPWWWIRFGPGISPGSRAG